MSYIASFREETEKNENFRTVLFTGEKSQFVVMCIPEGGEIGEETHDHVEQTLFIHSGSGVALLNGSEKEIGSGTVVVVTPGTKHNIVNTGETPLRIFTVYAPANHIEGRIHATKEEADRDIEDEEFGHQIQ